MVGATAARSRAADPGHTRSCTATSSKNAPGLTLPQAPSAVPSLLRLQLSLFALLTTETFSCSTCSMPKLFLHYERPGTPAFASCHHCLSAKNALLCSRRKPQSSFPGRPVTLCTVTGHRLLLPARCFAPVPAQTRSSLTFRRAVLWCNQGRPRSSSHQDVPLVAMARTAPWCAPAGTAQPVTTSLETACAPQEEPVPPASKVNISCGLHVRTSRGFRQWDGKGLEWNQFRCPEIFACAWVLLPKPPQGPCAHCHLLMSHCHLLVSHRLREAPVRGGLPADLLLPQRGALRRSRRLLLLCAWVDGEILRIR